MHVAASQYLRKTSAEHPRCAPMLLIGYFKGTTRCSAIAGESDRWRIKSDPGPWRRRVRYAGHEVSIRSIWAMASDTNRDARRCYRSSVDEIDGKTLVEDASAASAPIVRPTNRKASCAQGVAEPSGLRSPSQEAQKGSERSRTSRQLKRLAHQSRRWMSGEGRRVRVRARAARCRLAELCPCAGSCPRAADIG